MSNSTHHRKASIINKTIEKELSQHPLWSQEEKGLDAEVFVSYYADWTHAVWYITEADQNEEGDWLMYGFSTLGLGQEWDWGYVKLSDLREINGPYGKKIERDPNIEKGVTVRSLLSEKFTERELINILP